MSWCNLWISMDQCFSSEAVAFELPGQDNLSAVLKGDVTYCSRGKVGKLQIFTRSLQFFASSSAVKREETFLHNRLEKY